MNIDNILVIRFRQMGDAVLATPLLDTLRANFPQARIDFVLNERIAPLFENHKAIDRIITFKEEERHNKMAYIKKVWSIVHDIRYDVIIDMRSTVNTILFAAFSTSTKYTIGLDKAYTRLFFKYRIPKECMTHENMIDHNLRLAKPLLTGKSDTYCRELSLNITDEEKSKFRQYMQEQGIDFSRPVMLVGVTTKLENKTWPEERMAETLSLLTSKYPQLQLIFNYAKGKEAENARRIYEKMTLSQEPGLIPSSDSLHQKSIFLNIEAKSMRQLAAMAANCTAYFGNEGGARHIVHTMGRPSMVVCSPMANKRVWLPADTNIPVWGIAASDIAETKGLSSEQQYQLITVERVWEKLKDFIDNVVLKS